MQPSVRNALRADKQDIFDINTTSLGGVSPLDEAYFDSLFAPGTVFRVAELESGIAGYLCAMPQDAHYQGEEFIWFRNQLPGAFIYIDQIAIRAEHRGKGVARYLYNDLANIADDRGVGTLACEVNYDPFNLASQALHRKLGFNEIGKLPTRGLMVSLLVKHLAPRPQGI